MIRTENWWIEKYKERDAYWTHDGDPKSPHAELTSGRHSSGFFNSRPIIDDEDLLRDAAEDLSLLFLECGVLKFDASPEYVIGPQTGATKLAEKISIMLGMKFPCSWASPAKREEDGVKSMVFSKSERSMLWRRWVLLCEDVITTGGSVVRTEAALSELSCRISPVVLALVNRSESHRMNEKWFIALVNRHMPTWEPKDCPLCQGGSKPLRPKDNWPELTGQV